MKGQSPCELGMADGDSSDGSDEFMDALEDTIIQGSDDEEKKQDNEEEAAREAERVADEII